MKVLYKKQSKQFLLSFKIYFKVINVLYKAYDKIQKNFDKK